MKQIELTNEEIEYLKDFLIPNGKALSSLVIETNNSRYKKLLSLNKSILEKL